MGVLHVLSVLACMLISASAFVIRAEPDNVELNKTQNAKVTCVNDPINNPTDLVDVSRIRLEVLNGERWDVIADHYNNNQATTASNPNIYANGAIGPANTTFITAIWPVATDDILGEFRCELIGMNIYNEFVVEKTDLVNITEAVEPPTCEDICYMAQLELNILRSEFEQFQNDTYFREADILTQMQNKESMYQQMILDMQANFSRQYLELSQQYAALNDRLTCLDGGATTCGRNAQWPRGTYGFLQADSGCPSDSTDVSWQSGERRHHTEDVDSNTDRVSNNSHLAQPVTEVNNTVHYFYQRFCMANSTTGPEWPQGSYCINRKGGSCPVGFGSGYVFIDDETNAQESISGALPDGQYSQHTQVYYCCRDDGQTNNPISLPTSQPFYLYKFGGGDCQQVAGMTAVEEWLQMDTDNQSNADKYENNNHPDGRLDDLRIEFCYYS